MLEVPLSGGLTKILFASWVIFHAFLPSADFFQNQLFRKILSGIPSECYTVCVGPDLDPNCLQSLSANDTRR